MKFFSMEESICSNKWKVSHLMYLHLISKMKINPDWNYAIYLRLQIYKNSFYQP